MTARVGVSIVLADALYKHHLLAARDDFLRREEKRTAGMRVVVLEGSPYSPEDQTSLIRAPFWDDPANHSNLKKAIPFCPYRE